MGASHANEFSGSIHRPSLEEKLFFLSSGVITSVPLTLFVGTFTDSLCVVLPLTYATICSVAIFTPFIEEFAKAYPLFYRHGETERSLFSLGFLVGLGFGLKQFGITKEDFQLGDIALMSVATYRLTRILVFDKIFKLFRDFLKSRRKHPPPFPYR